MKVDEALGWSVVVVVSCEVVGVVGGGEASSPPADTLVSGASVALSGLRLLESAPGLLVSSRSGATVVTGSFWLGGSVSAELLELSLLTVVSVAGALVSGWAGGSELVDWLGSGWIGAEVVWVLDSSWLAVAVSCG